MAAIRPELVMEAAAVVVAAAATTAVSSSKCCLAPDSTWAASTCPSEKMASRISPSLIPMKL
jgi:hypothetical protein